MLSNYIKIALRNILKHKVYATINVAGLALGIVCSILIFLIIRYELSYNRHQSNQDNIYRVVREVKEERLLK